MRRRERTGVPRRGAPAALSLVDLLNAPELAVLDVLDHALHVARVALIAQHPHLLGDECGRVCHDGDRIARRAAELIDRALDLSGAVRRYRRAITNATALRDDDFPF
ncbi:MAG: hypothetical protein ACRENE_33520 [Polyangiaceae bacterium]